MPPTKPPHLTLPTTNRRNSDAKSPSTPFSFISRPSTPSTLQFAQGNSVQPSAAAAASSTGLRAQLAQLIPRHATFRARIQIHQLSSVPLIHGDFAARWKVGNVYVPGRFHRHWRKDHDDGYHGHPDAKSTPQGPVTDSEGSGEQDEESGIPSVVVSDSMSSSLTSTDFSTFSSTNTDATSLGSNTSHKEPSPTKLLSAVWAAPAAASGLRTPRPSTPVGHSGHSSGQHSPPFALDNLSSARGTTEEKPLNGHNVTWEQSLEMLVRIPIDRSTSVLQSSSLKITILKRSADTGHDKPHHDKYGTVYIDLAEYVSASTLAAAAATNKASGSAPGGGPPPTSRRHLLRGSKTNATLRVSISMEHVGGVTDYIAPELPPAEILGDIETFRKGVDGLARPRLHSLHSHTNSTSSRGSGYFGSFRKEQNEFIGKDGGFDLSKLPHAHGPRTTENLIDALFNPVPTSNTAPSPFTYYVPPGRVMAPSNRSTPPSPHSPSSSKSGIHATVKAQGNVVQFPSLRGKTKSEGGHDTLSMYSDSSEAATTSSNSTSWSGQREEPSRRRAWWRKLGGGGRGIEAS